MPAPIVMLKAAPGVRGEGQLNNCRFPANNCLAGFPDAGVKWGDPSDGAGEGSANGSIRADWRGRGKWGCKESGKGEVKKRRPNLRPPAGAMGRPIPGQACRIPHRDDPPGQATRIIRQFAGQVIHPILRRPGSALQFPAQQQQDYSIFYYSLPTPAYWAAAAAGTDRRSLSPVAGCYPRLPKARQRRVRVLPGLTMTYSSGRADRPPPSPSSCSKYGRESRGEGDAKTFEFSFR